MRKPTLLLAPPLLLALLVLAGPAAARTLLVGPGAPYPAPSAAAAAAQDGDHVVIAAGRYADCAVWRASRLLIEGAGRDATVIGDVACRGKGVFVIEGRGVTVRDLALVGAHVPDHNGAGIRAEGGDLTVERVRFAGNENGILSGADPAATIIVRDSDFVGNGSCASACAHGIYAGRIARLLVEHSRFRDTRAGHHIKSRAMATEIRHCDIADGPDGTASYLIDIPNGGAIAIEDNRLEKGPRSENATAAIALGAEGVRNPTPAIRVVGNAFRNDGAAPTAFVRNLTATPAQLTGNTVSGPAVVLEGPGSVR